MMADTPSCSLPTFDLFNLSHHQIWGVALHYTFKHFVLDDNLAEPRDPLRLKIRLGWTMPHFDGSGRKLANNLHRIAKLWRSWFSVKRTAACLCKPMATARSSS